MASEPTQHAESVAAELRAWADELCPEWGEELPHVTTIGDLAETHAKLLRQAAKLIEEERPGPVLEGLDIFEWAERADALVACHPGCGWNGEVTLDGRWTCPRCGQTHEWRDHRTVLNDGRDDAQADV